MSTPAPSAFPFNLHWTCDQLADSVPLRLFEIALSEIMPCGDGRIAASANHAPPPPRRCGYAPAGALSALFRVH